MRKRSRGAASGAILAPVLPAPGDVLVAVHGPGESAMRRHADPKRIGTCLTLITDNWGAHALVLMRDGTTKTCHGLNRGPGIGWHLAQ